MHGETLKFVNPPNPI